MVRQVSRFARQVLCFGIVLGPVAYALDLYRSLLGLSLYTEQLLAPALGAAIAIVFIGTADAFRIRPVCAGRSISSPPSPRQSPASTSAGATRHCR